MDRTNILRELVQTEKDFVNDLRLASELYVQPLRARGGKYATFPPLQTVSSNLITIRGFNQGGFFSCALPLG